MRMGSRYKMQQKVAKISKVLGITNLFYILNRNRKKIVCFHNIIPDEYFGDYLYLDFSTKESSFKKQIEIIKQKFDVGLDIYDNNQLTITFDDGYLNQYSIASKIMDKKNIKGYFFYAANLLEKQNTLYIDKIQYWITHVPYGIYENDKFGIRLEINNPEDRRIQWKKINNLIENKESMNKIHDLLDEMYPFNSIKIKEEFYNLRFNPITKANLTMMKNKGHKIGAHSASHEILSNLSKQQLEEDINMCVSLLSDIYNTKTFCYPYGSEKEVSEVVINLIQSKGFDKALSFINYLPNNKKFNNYFIPRMAIPDTDDEYVIEFVLSGAKYFLQNGKLLPKF